MKGYLVLVLLAVVGTVKARNSVNGTIEDDRRWFLSSLSVVPAMRATIEYDIWHPFQEYYKNYPPYITFYHMGQKSPNVRFECNKEMYGQLFNKDLAILLNEDYRENKSFCKSAHTTFANSRGRIEIQDFEPKTYFFSLGFDCSLRRSLNCFQYNVTIYDESNTTRCVDLNMTSDKGQQNLIDHCEISYQYAAIPNQFGDLDLDGAISRIKKFLSFNSSGAYPAIPSKLCLKKLRPLVCEIVLPKCLPEENRILLPCRGDCKFYMEGCLHEVMNCDYLLACEGRNSVSGIIRDNTKWFLSNLSVRPALTATIQYHIRFRRCNPIITFYYDGQKSTNFYYKYNKEIYGQLFNENLAIGLGRSGHTENHWCTSSSECYGRIDIQDFDPKSYSFSLGFDEECDKNQGLNCFNLYYDVTIYDESNTTRCLDLNMASKHSDMSQLNLTDHCQVSYQYAAIPNQFGDTDLDGAISRIKKFLRVYNSDDPSEHFLKNLKAFLCEIVLPKCLPEENKILLPCRQDCKFYMEGCLGKVMNCDYLPPCEGRNSGSGIITDNTTWFLSNLSVRPAMSASIQYRIQFQIQDVWNPQPIINFYYDGQNSTNFRDKYNKEMYGQLFNENLAVPLKGVHRENHRCFSTGIFTHYRQCYGRIDIQDFEAKSYSFSLSLGFDEDFDKFGFQQDLNGVYYDVTIYDESNTTRCVDLNVTHKYSDRSQQNLTDHCEANYQYVAIPNQFGDTDLDGAICRIKKFLRLNHSDVPSERFLKNLKTFLCEIVLPKCLPEENKILLPCRDDCKFYMKGYLKEDMNCDYLLPCEGRNSVIGTIEEDTTWFLSNLSVRPAMTASLDFHIQYPDVGGRPRPIITFYYNGQNSPNLRNECMDNFMQRQLHNKDLVIPLYDKYRENFWCNDRYALLKDCHGRIDIQDFEPKSYFFSLGFKCNETEGNLKGLKYDVTIYDESNETSCPSGIVNCNYLPPREGKTVTGGIEEDTTWFISNLSVRSAMSASIEYNIQYLDVPDHHRPIITFYYKGQNSPNLHDKCNSEMHGQLFNKELVIPLCGKYTETFWCNRKGWMKACHGRIKIQDFEPKSYFFSLGFKCNKTEGNLKGLKYDVTIYDESNKTSCMNLNLTQGKRTDLCELGYHYVAFPNPVGHTDLDEAISYVESFQMEFLEGKTIASRYVQHLNKECLKKLKSFLCEIFLPKCLPKENKILLPCSDICKSLMQNCSLSTIHGMEFNCDYLPPCPPTYPNYLVLGLSVGACVIVVVMVTVYCAKNTKKTDEPPLPRNRAFDAFVLYHFDSDDIYVVDTIMPELEETRNFKLHIHSRDFTPGCDIIDNIEEAIEGSNSAIIVMSQGFVDSMWCKEEFTHCYIENMKDAAFKLFVIMMQPAETLVNISPYMKTFFDTKTYLEVDDPELFTKLAALLDEARKPVKDDVDNHNNDNNDNIDNDDETQEEQETNV